jgi:hypothetical protein
MSEIIEVRSPEIRVPRAQGFWWYIDLVVNLPPGARITRIVFRAKDEAFPAGEECYNDPCVVCGGWCRFHQWRVIPGEDGYSQCSVRFQNESSDRDRLAQLIVSYTLAKASDDAPVELDSWINPVKTQERLLQEATLLLQRQQL